jgi:predicted DCC family thiol-disulfide oxidoreductase YuxK
MPAINDKLNPVILFDGVCNLCNSSVQFVLKRDKQDVFRFASLQSEVAEQLLKQYQHPVSQLNTFILIENGKVYSRSTAALRVFKKLAGLWPLLYVFIIVPPFIRNAVYNFIASHRYKWFGKKEECWIPSPYVKNKFL